MSWSVNAVGKAPAVAAKIAADLARNKCIEPEETVKQQLGQAIATALAAFPVASAVSVEASGSQWSAGDKSTHTFVVKVTNLYGFVE